MKSEILDFLLVGFMILVALVGVEGYVSFKEYANIKDSPTFLEHIGERVEEIQDNDEKEYHEYRKNQTEHEFTEVPDVKKRTLEDVSGDRNVTWKYLYKHYTSIG